MTSSAKLTVRRRTAAAVCLVLAGALAVGMAFAGSSAGARAASTTAAARVVVNAPATHNKCPRSRIDVPSCGVLWGMYSEPDHGGLPHYGHYEHAIGRPFDIVKDYVDWQPGVTFPNDRFTKLAGDGKRIIYISWNAINYDTRHVVYYQNIARGDYDKSVILPEARRLRKFHHRIFIDFNHEFDSHSQSGKGSPAEYVAAFRHIHRVFARAGVKNVIWSWVSTGYLGNADYIKASWPGARYVDWVGYDPYNFASCTGRPWRTPYKTFHPFYRWARHQPGMKHKPMLLGEYGSAPGKSIKHWYASLAQTLKRLHRIKALFQWSAPTVENCKVSLAYSKAALAGFKQSANSRYVTGRK